MTNTVAIPLWLVIIASIFIVWAILDTILMPSVRWFFRRRVNRIITQINTRLQIKLPKFELLKRDILIDRLLYHPDVLCAVKEYCRETDTPNRVAMAQVEHYAKEIIPSFNAYMYFRVGSWLSRVVIRFLYRVRIGFSDDKGFEKIKKDSSVVFIMNHRSNTDYILLAYLALNKVQLSFAVGEWARIWPVQQLVSSLGGYFVRRGSGNKLYRRVLACYVQMATQAGVVQAVYPEGGLTRDGKLQDPKLGLLDYMLRAFDPDSERDLVFIPVAVNYDRVLEDRTLLVKKDEVKKTAWQVFKTTSNFIRRHLWLKISGQWFRFGYAVVNFGTPISMREYVEKHHLHFNELTRELRFEKVKLLAKDLIAEIGKQVPVTSVSLLSTVFLAEPDMVFTELKLKAKVFQLLEQLKQKEITVHIPHGDLDYMISYGLKMLKTRHIILYDRGEYRTNHDNLNVLSYYANSIVHHFN